MAKLRLKILSFTVAAAFITVMVFTSVYAQGGLSPDQSGAAMASAPGGPGGMPEGMPTGGAPGGMGGIPGGMENPSAGGPGGMPGGAPMPSGGSGPSVDGAKKAAENAVIVVDDDSVKVREDAATLVKADDYKITRDVISGVSIYSENIKNSYNEGKDAVSFGVSGISVLDSDIKIGDSTDCFSVKKNAQGVPVATKSKKGNGYNSVIVLDNKGDTFGRSSAELSGGVGVSIGGDNSVGKLLEIENVYLWVDGWKRTTVFSNYASSAKNAGPGLSGPSVVVKDSYMEAPGNENYKYGWMALYGGARTTLIQASYAWFYNDTIKTEGWGSLAIDGGPVINLYAVNSDLENYGGGYIIYSPGDGWAELFGVKAISAQYGMFLTGNASGKIGSLNDAVGTDAEKHMKVNEIKKAEYVNRGGRSYIEADFAAFLVHLGGASSVSTLYASNSTFSTKNTRILKDDSNLLNDGNSGASWFWVDDWRGSTLLSRSSNPVINLDNVELVSRTGVIFQSTIDWEGSNKKTQFSLADGTEAAGIALKMNNMKADGDILHDDFFRKMDIKLTNTSLTGRVFSGTKAGWNAKWSVDALKPSDAWKAAEAEIAGWAKIVPNHIFTYDPAFTLDAKAISDVLSCNVENDDIWGVRMTLDSKSTWVVTGDSSLYSLTIADGAKVKPSRGRNITIYKDCKMDSNAVFYDYTTGTVVKDLEPGITYKGIVILVQK
jgi:hypothetical protein